MLYRQSPKFALIAACGLPFVVIFVTFFLRKASPLFAIVQKKLDGINNVMQENVAGARVVKAYVKEEHELERFDHANAELCEQNLRVRTLLAFMGPCMNIVLNICIVAVILVGGIEVKNGGNITPGNVMAGITYLTQILHGVTFMANIFQTFIRAKASADRINEVLQCPSFVTKFPLCFRKRSFIHDRLKPIFVGAKMRLLLGKSKRQRKLHRQMISSVLPDMAIIPW